MRFRLFPLHISSSRVEISLHTEFELPRPAGTIILVVKPIVDGGGEWVGLGPGHFLFL